MLEKKQLVCIHKPKSISQDHLLQKISCIYYYYYVQHVQSNTHIRHHSLQQKEEYDFSFCISRK